MHDLAGPAMHDLLCVIHLATEKMTQSLMTEADAQHWNIGFKNGLGADAEISSYLRTARPGRNDDVVEIQVAYFIPWRRVVVHDDRRYAIHLRQILVEIERERIVVVDQQCSHRAFGTDAVPELS